MSIPEQPESSTGDRTPDPWHFWLAPPFENGFEVARCLAEGVRGERVCIAKNREDARFIAEAPKTKRQRDLLLTALKDCVEGLDMTAAGLEIIDGEIRSLEARLGTATGRVGVDMGSMRYVLAKYKALIAECEE